MTREKHAWSIKEGYVLALIPTLGLACVHLYEAGRFSFLGIPSGLIDLPVTRLIGGGTAIAIFATIVIGFVQWAREKLFVKSSIRRAIGIYGICFVLLGVPALFQSSTFNALVWTFLLPLCIAFNWPSPEEIKKPKDAKSTESTLPGKVALQDRAPNVLGFLFLAGLLAWQIFSIGYFSERMTSRRMCVDGERTAFIAGFYGDRAIIKHPEQPSGKLKNSVELRELDKNLQLHECAIRVQGMPGVFDRAFNPDRYKDKAKSTTATDE